MQWVIFYNLKCPIGLLGQVYKSTNNPPQFQGHRPEELLNQLRPPCGLSNAVVHNPLSFWQIRWLDKPPTQSS